MSFLRSRRFGAAALLAAAWIALPALAASTVTTPQVRAELVAHAPEGVEPGKPMWLGLQIKHQPHWHTYWKNPGDSGLPTTLAWQLPPGVEAGEIDWPAPQRLPIGPLTNHGYEGTVLLPVPITIPANFSGASLDVKLRADWLVCKTECIPESGEFTLSVPAQAATVDQRQAFEAAWAARPETLSATRATAKVDAGQLVIDVRGLPAELRGRQAEVFSELGGVVDHAAAVTQAWRDADWQARVPLNAQRSESPAVLPAVLRFDGAARALRVEATVDGGWPATAAPATVSPALQAAIDAGRAATPPPAAAGAAPGLLLAVGLALLGGLLLNLMPCVFPVLSLKVLGVVQHASDRRALAAGGVAYTAGVLVSFVALAGLLLALRAAGEQLGWGFQLQSPGFVAALAVLFTLIGLNLAGVFHLGSVLPSGLATLQARHPLADAFVTGVLAVAIASPCTAPFMGASLGAAATLPAAQALLVFAALGLGMALPYLLLSVMPGWARVLPRPGAWMARLRHAMAFPMFATVVWLVWVLGQQTSLDGAVALLGVLVVLAMVAWAWGTPGWGRAARVGLGGFALALLGVTVAWAWPQWRESAGTPAAVAAGEAWQPWSTQRVAELRAAGTPVFVDFTAAWCVTCQFNKRTVLNDATVVEAFKGKRVALLRADWTRRDAAIGAELQRLGRSGVPVYVLYAPGASAPVLLSEILSAAEVQGALAKL